MQQHFGEGMMQLQIINTDPRYSSVKLIEPTTLSYIQIAAVVHPRPASFLPI
jgi:hypothetical protein